MTNEWNKTKLARLGFRIATVVFSLWSGIKTATTSQTVQDGSTVTSSDSPSFQYASVSDLLSAVLQGVVIYLEVMGAKKSSKLVEMIDKIAVALMSTSTALLFAVDEITSCGPGRRSICKQAREFCNGLRQASHVSLAGTVSVASAVYIRRAPEALILVNRLFCFDHRPDSGRSSEYTSSLSSQSPPPPPPRPPKHNVELLITGSASPCQLPTGLRLSVSSHYEDEDGETGRDD